MVEQTMKQKFLNWLKGLWGQDEIMMQRMPSEKLDFRLGKKER